MLNAEGESKDLLEHNVSIIAANKIAASSEYENYEKLKKTATQTGPDIRASACDLG